MPEQIALRICSCISDQSPGAGSTPKPLYKFQQDAGAFSVGSNTTLSYCRRSTLNSHHSAADLVTALQSLPMIEIGRFIKSFFKSVNSIRISTWRSSIG